MAELEKQLATCERDTEPFDARTVPSGGQRASRSGVSPNAEPLRSCSPAPRHRTHVMQRAPHNQVTPTDCIPSGGFGTRSPSDSDGLGRAAHQRDAARKGSKSRPGQAAPPNETKRAWPGRPACCNPIEIKAVRGPELAPLSQRVTALRADAWAWVWPRWGAWPPTLSSGVRKRRRACRPGDGSRGTHYVP